MTREQSLKKLYKAAAFVLKCEGEPKLRVDIVFVGPKKMHELNLKYRGKDKPTDVLSFRHLDVRDKFGDPKFLGEIILCSSYLRCQAKEYDVPYEEELVRMTIHGTLHLLNYDHIKPADAKKMLPLQEKYLAKFL